MNNVPLRVGGLTNLKLSIDPLVAKRLETSLGLNPNFGPYILNPHPGTPYIKLDTLLFQFLIKS